MRLTQRLLSRLNRVFRKDPKPFLALRLSYNGGMVWTVQDGLLTTTVTGGAGAGLTVDLSSYTLASLASFLSAQPGYSVPYLDGSGLASLSALVLLDGFADIASSNGDHLFGYSNMNWSVLEAGAWQLASAAASVMAMPAEMSTATADGEWIDLLGSYYAVPRRLGEGDGQYAPRIIATVLQPRSNNVAIEAVLTAVTGQPCRVDDVSYFQSPTPAHNGTIHRDGAHTYNAVSGVIYGLFDVSTGYDLLSAADPVAFLALVRDTVESLRAAGTHLRALSLTGSALSDASPGPRDDEAALSVGVAIADVVAAPADITRAMQIAMTGLSDSVTAPDDATDTMNIVYTTRHNGQRRRNGAVPYASGGVLVGTIEGDVSSSGEAIFTEGGLVLTNESGVPITP